MTVSKPTNLPTTVLSLLNSMFGCSIMVLPLLSLALPWTLLFPIVVATVLANWYSCQLVLQHLGPWNDVGDLVSCHFKSSFPRKLYDFAAALGLLTASTVYFKLIVLQLQGLVLDYDHSSLNTVLNGVILVLWCIAAKYCDIDTHLSGFGFVSIAGYLLFLGWAALSRPDAPQAPASIGQSDPAAFTAVMNNALAIQFIFVPIIKSYQQRTNYTTVIALTFLVTLAVYLYIDGVGAFAIVTRQSQGVEETVENYFSQDEWQVKAIQSIYLFHLYTVFPQYMLAAKKRVFALFSLPQTTPHTINPKELLFLVAILSVAVCIQIANINIKYIITFHGAVFGFIYSYLVPCMFHIKCAYIDQRNDVKHQERELSPEELDNKGQAVEGGGEISAVDIKEQSLEVNESQTQTKSERNPEKQEEKKRCYFRRPSFIWQVLDWTMISLMLGLGCFVLIYQLKQLF